jgi:hypothetical protein
VDSVIWTVSLISIYFGSYLQIIGIAQTTVEAEEEEEDDE